MVINQWLLREGRQIAWTSYKLVFTFTLLLAFLHIVAKVQMWFVTSLLKILSDFYCSRIKTNTINMTYKALLCLASAFISKLILSHAILCSLNSADTGLPLFLLMGHVPPLYKPNILPEMFIHPTSIPSLCLIKFY